MIVKKEDALQHLVDEINKAAEVAAILVEGKNDRKALQQIGIKGDFYLKNHRHYSPEIIQEVLDTYSIDIINEGKTLLKERREKERKCWRG